MSDRSSVSSRSSTNSKERKVSSSSSSSSSSDDDDVSVKTPVETKTTDVAKTEEDKKSVDIETAQAKVDSAASLIKPSRPSSERSVSQFQDGKEITLTESDSQDPPRPLSKQGIQNPTEEPRAGSALSSVKSDRPASKTSISQSQDGKKEGTTPTGSTTNLQQSRSQSKQSGQMPLVHPRTGSASSVKSSRSPSQRSISQRQDARKAETTPNGSKTPSRQSNQDNVVHENPKLIRPTSKQSINQAAKSTSSPKTSRPSSKTSTSSRTSARLDSTKTPSPKVKRASSQKSVALNASKQQESPKVSGPTSKQSHTAEVNGTSPQGSPKSSRTSSKQDVISESDPVSSKNTKVAVVDEKEVTVQSTSQSNVVDETPLVPDAVSNRNINAPSTNKVNGEDDENCSSLSRDSSSNAGEEKKISKASSEISTPKPTSRSSISAGEAGKNEEKMSHHAISGSQEDPNISKDAGFEEEKQDGYTPVAPSTTSTRSKSRESEKRSEKQSSPRPSSSSKSESEISRSSSQSSMSLPDISQGSQRKSVTPPPTFETPLQRPPSEIEESASQHSAHSVVAELKGLSPGTDAMKPEKSELSDKSMDGAFIDSGDSEEVKLSRRLSSTVRQVLLGQHLPEHLKARHQASYFLSAVVSVVFMRSRLV